MTNNFVSTTEYAIRLGLSRMQVNRLVRMGKIPAKRLGKRWMIIDKGDNLNQIGMEKTTSLQKWNKIIREELKKSLNIEESKDRELIYARLHGLGLPHERNLAFGFGKFPTKDEFDIAVNRLGLPYWISAVPDPAYNHLNRVSKLRLYEINAGWEFINDLPEKEHYKVIVCQYADEPVFKGTAMITPLGNGMAEFVTGDRHYILTRGFTLTDPMLFDQKMIRRFSRTVSVPKQKKLFNLMRGIYGHMEFQYGTIEGKKEITFFDYNDEEGYLQIGEIWEDLIRYFKRAKKTNHKTIYGLPASLGKAEGRCVVVHHETTGMFNEIKKGDILVADTTTPEMTPIMSKVAAILTDLGGVTSHAAIVCRELEIPAIVGCKDATAKLRTGDIVRVDADKGVIEILDK
jgi:excisionase family DNA binding protein